MSDDSMYYYRSEQETSKNFLGQPRRFAPPGVGDDVIDTGVVRKFATGATRDTGQDKLDYEAFLAPTVLERIAQYMHHHRFQSDGSIRDGDNWQRGIPIPVYLKSLVRHVMDLWKHYRKTGQIDQDLACAVFFNTQGLLYEALGGARELSPALAPSSTQESAVNAVPPIGME